MDPALVHHFFGTKEQLFAAAMQLPLVPGELLSAALAPGARDPAVSLGVHLAAVVLSVWDVSDVRVNLLALVRSAGTSEQALTMLREFITETILARLSGVTRAASPAEAEYRAGLAASQIVGLLMTRYALGLGPLAAAARDDLVAAIGPTLDRYLTGDIG